MNIVHMTKHFTRIDQSDARVIEELNILS